VWRRLDAAFCRSGLETQGRTRRSARPGWSKRSAAAPFRRVQCAGFGLDGKRGRCLAFLPKISREIARRGAFCCRAVATLGGAGRTVERRHVLDNFDDMVIGPALSTRLAFEDDDSDQARLGSVA